MKCYKCGSQWESKKILNICPFCGQSLKDDTNSKIKFDNKTDHENNPQESEFLSDINRSVSKNDGLVADVCKKDENRCNVDSWKDIVAISAGMNHTVGLEKDGTVVAVGYNGSGQCNVSSWKDIVAISAGEFHTVGLKKDGTVINSNSNSVNC